MKFGESGLEPVKSALQLRRAILGLCWGILFAVAAATAVSSPGRAAINPFSEVPFNHWSYAALERMAELQLSDRRFGAIVQLGYQLTRLDMALETALILDKLASRVQQQGAATLQSPVLVQPSADTLRDVATLVAQYNAMVPPEERITDEDRDLLIDLVMYFYNDLEALGYKVQPSAGAVQAQGIELVGRSLGRWHVTAEGVYQVSGYSRMEPGAQLVSETAFSHEYVFDVGYSSDDFLLGAIIQTSGKQPLDLGGGEASIRLSLLEFTYRNLLVARIGELNTAQWDELTVAPVPSLLGVQADFNMGDIGSTLLVFQRPGSDGQAYLAGLDGTLNADRFTLGASLVHIFSGDNTPSSESGTVASVQGSYTLSPGWVISAGLAGSVWGANELGTALQLIGEFELGEGRSLRAVYRLTEPNFRRAFAEQAEGGSRAFDLSLGLGGAQLTAGIGRTENGGEGVSTTRSLGLRLSGYQVLDASVVFHASREETTYTGLSPEGAPVVTQVTAVGIDFELPHFSVTLGYEVEDAFNQGSLRSTQMGVDFQAMGGSISLNYRVIDSTGLSAFEETRTTAEFSLRF